MTRRMDASLLILLGLVAIAASLAFWKDPALPMRALEASARLFRGVWLDLLLGFVLAGLMDVLIPQPVLSRWLGADHPFRGILVGWGLGLLIPGAPISSFRSSPVSSRRGPRRVR